MRKKWINIGKKIAIGITAPITPIIIPSTKNGAFTKKSVAPINFMIDQRYERLINQI